MQWIGNDGEMGEKWDGLERTLNHKRRWTNTWKSVTV